MGTGDALAIAKRLAAMRELSAAECERALGCRLVPDKRHPRQFWGRDLTAPIASLDVRIGERGGVVVVNLDPDADRSAYAREVMALAAPAGIDVVSPPILDPQQAGPGPSWERKWSVTHAVDGQEIAFGLEEQQGRETLVYISRQFPGAAERRT